jgi:hypothetical protein
MVFGPGGSPFTRDYTVSREALPRLYLYCQCNLETRPNSRLEYYVHVTRDGRNRDSSIFNPILLTSLDDSSCDLGNNGAEFIVLGLRALSASGGLSRVSVIRRKGTQTKSFG